ncbi:hypothetical protein KM043_017925 [Ampulex compressa]|nr:hypothetical protein KM043_017925 [Ampulex compressa]
MATTRASTGTKPKEMPREDQLPTTGAKHELLARPLEAGFVEEDIRRSLTAQTGSGEDEATTVQEESVEPRSALSIENRVNELDLLRRERELVDREIRLLRRELEVMRLEAQTRADKFPEAQSRADKFPEARKVEIRWTDVKYLISDYDGVNYNINIWEAQVSKLIEMYGLCEQAAKAMVCHKLKGKALRWYRSRPNCVEMTVGQLLNGLRTKFGQWSNILYLKQKFEKRNWRSNESFIDYVREKIVLGYRVPIADMEIVDYIVESIPDMYIRLSAKIQRFPNPVELLSVLSKLELLKEDQRPMSGPQQMMKAVAIKKSCIKKKHQGSTSAGGNRLYSCYNCGKTGHYANKCRYPPKDDNYIGYIELIDA